MNVVLNGNVQAVKGLIKRGADPSLMDNHGWSLLHFAAYCGDPHMIDLILSHVPGIESKAANGVTPLLIAVCHGKLQAVKYLLGRGANPLTKDNNGQDALFFASSRGSDVLDLLLSHVANGESTLGLGGGKNNLICLLDLQGRSTLRSIYSCFKKASRKKNVYRLT